MFGGQGTVLRAIWCQQRTDHPGTDDDLLHDNTFQFIEMGDRCIKLNFVLGREAFDPSAGGFGPVLVPDGDSFPSSILHKRSREDQQLSSSEQVGDSAYSMIVRRGSPRRRWKGSEYAHPLQASPDSPLRARYCPQDDGLYECR
jgi:hypothetical protein